MAHRVTPTGTFSYGPFYLYGYELSADPRKLIQSIIPPTDSPIVVIAAASANAQGKARPVDLYSAFNVFGAFDDGHTIVGDGLGSLNNAYSASLVGTALARSGIHLSSAAPVFATQSAAPRSRCRPGHSLNCNCGQLPLMATVQCKALRLYTQIARARYLSSRSATGTNPQAYLGESIASSMAYRLDSGGSPHTGSYHLCGYSFMLDPNRTVKSVVLPGSLHVMTFTMRLVP